MVDDREVAHLLELALDGLALRLVVDLEELDRVGLADRVLARLVDLAEGAAAEAVLDLVCDGSVLRWPA